MPDIEIKRGYEVLPDNNVRFGIRVINNGDFAISDVEVILDYSESLFEIEGNKIQKLGNIPPTVPRTAKFILKPLGCIHKENIGATVIYKDHQWKKHTLEMHTKEVHCVCPFLREKSITRAEFLNFSKSGYSAEQGVNFENISIEKLVDFLTHTCKNRLYRVDEIPIENGKILYLSGEALGERAYYLLTAVVKEYEGLSQVLLRANSDKNYGLNGFLNEILDNLHHLVQTVHAAREIGVIRKEQVINIIDSVVQRTTFGGGEGGASVNIKDSVVQRTEFEGDEGRKKREEERLRKEREEQEKLRRQKQEEEQAQREKDEEDRQRKAQEVEEQGRKAREERERQRKIKAQRKEKELQEQRAEEERLNLKEQQEKAKRERKAQEEDEQREKEKKKQEEEREMRRKKEFKTTESIPKYEGIDPAAVFFITFPLFYGIMLGDVGYGIIVAALAYIIKNKFKTVGLNSLALILFMSGVLSTFFGFIFGEFFGFPIFHMEIEGEINPGLLGIYGPVIAGIHMPVHRFGEVQYLLLLTFAIGILHILLGLILGFRNHLIEHGLKHAILAKGSWMIILIGGVLAIAKLMPSVTSKHPAEGYLIFIVGAVLAVAGLILLIAGEGFISILELPTIMSGLLSYLWIIGLSLAGISYVVNDLSMGIFIKPDGVLMGGGIFSALVGVVIFFIGHVINLLLGIFGLGFKSLRLQYSEFFTYFMKRR